MKTLTYFLLVAGLFSALGLDAPEGKPEQDRAAQKIAQAYADDFRVFQDEAGELAELAWEPFGLFRLQQQLTRTRIAFKKVEYLFDYWKPHYNYLHINGAPLPKIDKENVNGDIIPPNGLQALDELLFSEEAEEEQEQVKKLAAELKASADFIAKVHLPISLSDAQAIEAMRSGIVRVFTLGLTGFDTPGSGNALPEAMASIESMEKAFPEGAYQITGIDTEDSGFKAEATLSHQLPATASFQNPAPEAEDVPIKGMVVKWGPVEGVSEYIVEVEAEGEGMNASIAATLPGSAQSFAVPDGFLQPGAEYKVAIGTVSEAGNRSFVETTFSTAGGEEGEEE